MSRVVYLYFSNLVDICSSFLLQAFLLIFFSELGDKTFFIAVSINKLVNAYLVKLTPD